MNTNTLFAQSTPKGYCDVAVIVYVETAEDSARLFGALDDISRIPDSDMLRSAYIGTAIGEKDNFRCVVVRWDVSDMDGAAAAISEDRFRGSLEQKLTELNLPYVFLGEDPSLRAIKYSGFEPLGVYREIEVA